jgi:hypothetical protein
VSNCGDAAQDGARSCRTGGPLSGCLPGYWRVLATVSRFQPLPRRQGRIPPFPQYPPGPSAGAHRRPPSSQPITYRCGTSLPPYQAPSLGSGTVPVTRAFLTSGVTAPPLQAGKNTFVRPAMEQIEFWDEGIRPNRITPLCLSSGILGQACFSLADSHPPPGTLVLLTTGLAGVALCRQRRDLLRR